MTTRRVFDGSAFLPARGAPRARTPSGRLICLQARQVCPSRELEWAQVNRLDFRRG